MAVSKYRITYRVSGFLAHNQRFGVSSGARISFLILARVRKSVTAIVPREVLRIFAISASL
jgi:hypothetical protein